MSFLSYQKYAGKYAKYWKYWKKYVKKYFFTYLNIYVESSNKYEEARTSTSIISKAAHFLPHTEN